MVTSAAPNPPSHCHQSNKAVHFIPEVDGPADRKKQMGGTGLEPPCEIAGQSDFFRMGDADSDAIRIEQARADRELTALLEAWPALPAAIKAAIVALVRASVEPDKLQ